jgi:chromosome segregation ATPase
VPLAPSWVIGETTKTVAKLVPAPKDNRFAIDIQQDVAAAEMLAAKVQAQANERFASFSQLTEQLRDATKLGEQQTAGIAELEARIAGLVEEARLAAEALAARDEDLRITREIVVQKDAELASLDRELAAKTVESDGQRVEIVALKTEGENLRNQGAALSKTLAETEASLRETRLSLEETTATLTSERVRAASLEAEIGDLSRRLAEETTLANARLAQIGELDLSLANARERATREGLARDDAEKAHALMERERDQVRRSHESLIEEHETRLSEALRAASDARVRLAAVEQDLAAAKALAVASPKQAAAALPAQSPVTDDDARILLATLERVAAEVAAVTALVEGPEGQVETLLAADAARKGAGAPTSPDLADSIRQALAAARPKVG